MDEELPVIALSRRQHAGGSGGRAGRRRVPWRRRFAGSGLTALVVAAALMRPDHVSMHLDTTGPTPPTSPTSAHLMTSAPR